MTIGRFPPFVKKVEVESHYSFFCQQDNKDTLPCFWCILCPEDSAMEKNPLFSVDLEIFLQVWASSWLSALLKHEVTLRTDQHLKTLLQPILIPAPVPGAREHQDIFNLSLASFSVGNLLMDTE